MLASPKVQEIEAALIKLCTDFDLGNTCLLLTSNYMFTSNRTVDVDYIYGMLNRYEAIIRLEILDNYINEKQLTKKALESKKDNEVKDEQH